MDKKIVLMVISIVFSIITLLVSYYGITRYIALHTSSSEKYVIDYSKLPKADKNCKVVISLTTTPDKIDKIRPMIRSILDQTVKVDQITLNIPYSSDGDTFEIPDDYKDCMNVFRCGKDYGAGCKYIPTLLREGEEDTKIICLQDDYAYGKDMIESLVDTSNKNPNSSVHSVGAILIKPAFFDMNVIGEARKGTCSLDNSLKAKRVEITSAETFKTI